jgi:hypothetical protein
LAQEVVRYERNPDYIFRRVVDELVLVPIHQDVADMDCIYTMNPVGALIWERLHQPATQAELAEAVMAEYDADPAVLATDLEDFLREMVEIEALRKV